jgi:hypothetical protein
LLTGFIAPVGFQRRSVISTLVGKHTPSMKISNNSKRSRTLILSALIVVGAACGLWLFSGLPQPQELTLAVPSCQATGTQILVSVVFTNLTRGPLVCARNSSVERLAGEDWTTSICNNLSIPDPLTVAPGQVGHFQLRLPRGATQLKITTHVSALGWDGFVLSKLPEKLIPDSVGRILGDRFVKRCRFIPVSSGEIPVAPDCEQHKMFSGDLEALRQNVERLKANQAVQRTGASRSAHIEIRPSVAAGPGR